MANAKAKQQRELLPLEHRGRLRQRLRKSAAVNPERIYAAVWMRFMRSGRHLLEHILCEKDGTPAPVSRRDAFVAASIVQWLGTNVGGSIIWEAERKIDAAREAGHAFDRISITERRRAREAAAKRRRDRDARDIELED